jgi:Uma2 family endonuclease
VATRTSSTIDALYRVRDNAKAEIVDGELVPMSPTGALPGLAATAIAASLRAYQRHKGGGHAFGDNVGFLIHLAHRESISPDAAWFTGPVRGLDFPEGAPAFAAEVRSKGDYGPKAEAEMAAKRADYFAAGTLVVWDVDLMSDEVVRAYRADSPLAPTVYRRGAEAEAEPGVPGWHMAVDELFE